MDIAVLSASCSLMHATTARKSRSRPRQKRARANRPRVFVVFVSVLPFIPFFEWINVSFEIAFWFVGLSLTRVVSLSLYSRRAGRRVKD